MRNIWKSVFKLVPAAIIIILIIALFRCRFQDCKLVRLDSANIITMNTAAKIIAIADDEQTAEGAIIAASEKIRTLEKLMNRYDQNSQISILNRQAFKYAVEIEPDLFDIIEKSVYYSRQTCGAFDITVAPLIDLFKACSRTNSLPTVEQISAVKERIGSEKLILDKNKLSVRFAVDGMKIDLGAIAKGFAIDTAISEMIKSGAVGGLVDIGGDIGCFGLTEENEKWIVGLQDPCGPDDGKTVAKLAMTDMAIATSGDYRRFYTIGGHNFSHIFNPITEKSASGLSSVTIIAPKATAADVLATAVSVLGAEKGLELIENTPFTEAILITSTSGKKTQTSTAEQYMLK